jgi:predicted dehydrogenase
MHPPVASRPSWSRRRFLAATAVTAGWQIVPRRVIAQSGERAPNEKLNLAFVGVGGRGGDTLPGFAHENVVALCDVDDRAAGRSQSRFPQARRFRDYRKMFDVMDREIDAVVVSTPDHTHAVIGNEAMRRGKHLFCEKPLAHSIREVRSMMATAREQKVITQLGNQGHSYDSIRTFVEWVRGGAVGRVHTVYARCRSNYSKINRLPQLAEHPPVPAELDWDTWLGPVPFRPYHPVYLPGQWRGWSPFGTGVIGDWICHVVDPIYWALNLGAPASITAQAFGPYHPQAHADTFPAGMQVTYEFPAREGRGPVKLVWLDGQVPPPALPQLPAGEGFPDIGAVIVGDDGALVHGSHGASHFRLLPEARLESWTKPGRSLPRIPDHQRDWTDAVRAGRPSGSGFEYGGGLTELALLGVMALHRPGEKLMWDGVKGRFLNSEAANQRLTPPWREGWKL